MNLKVLIALFSIGILVLLGATGVVASLPSSSAAAPKVLASSVGADARSRHLPTGWTKSHARRPSSQSNGAAFAPVTRHLVTTTAPSTTTPTTAPPTTTSLPPSPPATEPPSPTSTAFVLQTISYEVKAGDTVQSIQNWFDAHGFGVQFAANLQVIESNEDLLVPGAIVSLSNGVMTIHSPL